MSKISKKLLKIARLISPNWKLFVNALNEFSLRDDFLNTVLLKDKSIFLNNIVIIRGKYIYTSFF
jgi:hypothetical protein